MIIVAKNKAEVYSKKIELRLTIITEIRLMWMPGVNPVRIPQRIPIVIAIKSVHIIDN